MSDDDFMQASDEEYDFEYEDEEEEDSGDVDIENKYYNAKQTKTSDPEEAVGEFLGIPALEPEKGEWGFKALKQAIKLEFKLQRYEKVRDPGAAGLAAGYLTNGRPPSTTASS
jgi:COP9 signalosome complex subunit 2